ncbi:MAG: hypothetical protein AABP62_05815 [Planctomycetota bacterium]
MIRSTQPPSIKKLAAAKQRRMDELLERNSEGQITPRERATLERLVAEAEALMVENAKRLSAFSQQPEGVPANAVPVTVWISPVVAGKG